MSLVFLLHTLTPLAFLAVPHPVGTRVRAGTFHRPAAPRDALRPSLAADAVKIALLPPLANFVTDATGAASTPLSAVTRENISYCSRTQNAEFQRRVKLCKFGAANHFKFGHEI